MNDKVVLPLMCIFEGYVRNYRSFNLFQNQNKSMFTKREIDYFSKIGEYLGFFSYVEDRKPNLDYGRSRPMDLAWWKWDERVSKTEFVRLVLHLERENNTEKDFETLDKIFCKTQDEYVPDNVIGILNVSDFSKVSKLQEEVKKRNQNQKSNVLMVYRYYDHEKDFDHIEAYFLSGDLLKTEMRKCLSKIDDTGYWTMSFVEEVEEWLK